MAKMPAPKSGKPHNAQRQEHEMGRVAKVAGQVGKGRMPSSEHPYDHEHVHAARKETASQGMHASHAGHHGHAHETGTMSPED
jgi:hypothetical protein